MASVQVELPESVLAALRKAPHEVGPEMRIAAAIHWYQQSVISMERAAENARTAMVIFDCIVCLRVCCVRCGADPAQTCSYATEIVS